MTHFVPVSHPAYYAAHRFRIISGLGGRVRRIGGTTEFVTDSGEVLCRKITPIDRPSGAWSEGQAECWLRADLADTAAEFLIREEQESARIAADVIEFSRDRDQQRAADAGLSLEAYRNKRNAALARIDAKNGRNSLGMR